MASERKIYCQYCKTYVGVIRDASLMKGLVYTCVACQEPEEDVYTPSHDHDFDSGGDFMSIFNGIVNKGKKGW